MTLYYLASPYTHPYEAVKDERAYLAAKATRHLLENYPGLNIFSPIVHSHVLHRAGMGGDWKTWKAIDEDYLNRVDGMVILALPGWEDSVGVSAEIEIVRALGLPIFVLPISPNGGFGRITTLAAFTR